MLTEPDCDVLASNNGTDHADSFYGAPAADNELRAHIVARS